MDVLGCKLGLPGSKSLQDTEYRLSYAAARRSSRYAPWHRNPGYGFRRERYDHPGFTSKALREDLFRDKYPSVQTHMANQVSCATVRYPKKIGDT